MNHYYTIKKLIMIFHFLNKNLIKNLIQLLKLLMKIMIDMIKK